MPTAYVVDRRVAMSRVQSSTTSTFAKDIHGICIRPFMSVSKAEVKERPRQLIKLGLNKGVLKLAADWLQSCNNKVKLWKKGKGLRKPEGLIVTIYIALLEMYTNQKSFQCERL